ncbi:Alpha/Beta hydrolase protein [Dipodascopsis tothii]|uniref:Alpha/Beta hydrolase protein n=1 Tax=Dipodascopsis tothii TaxID=44089 RepID=UPI0034CF4B7E
MADTLVDEEKFGVFASPANPAVHLFYKLVPCSSGAATAKDVIVLSNSLTADVTIWNEFVAAFKDDYTLLLYDQRFHGSSPAAPAYDYDKGTTFDELAADVRDLLDHLGIARVRALVGLSMGSTTAVVFAAAYPDRVDRIVVAGTGLRSAPNAKSAEDPFEQRIALARDQGMAVLADATIERWFPVPAGGADFKQEQAERVREIRAVAAGTSLGAFVASVRALQAFDLTASLDKIVGDGRAADVLLVAGELDGPLPAAMGGMADKWGLRLEVVGGCGHIVNVQAADRFNALVRSFIE